MKAIILTVLISAGSLMAAQAQQHWSLGPNVGFGHSWLKTDEDMNVEFHPSYSIGAKLVYSIDPHWGASADLLFSSEGGQFEMNEMDYKYRANYIRVPIQAIYFFGELGNKVRPKVSLGPSFGFLVGGKSAVEQDGESDDDYATKDIFKGFDIGLNAAAGLNFRLMRNTWMNTDVTYYHGFSDISESGSSIRNRGVRLNAGVAFGIGSGK